MKARCSFKMVISRLREHFARGQFNSGRMIAPSRSYCPTFIFLRLPLPIQTRMSSDSARSNSLYIPGATLRLPSARSFFEGSPARKSLCTIDSSPSSPLYFFPRASMAFSLPSNYFDGNCFSLVSIRVYSIRNFPIVINRGDQASSSINIQLSLSLSDSAVPLLSPRNTGIPLLREHLQQIMTIRKCVLFEESLKVMEILQRSSIAKYIIYVYETNKVMPI